MAQVEVTLKSPGNDVSENVMDDLSNPSANADRAISCITNTSSEHGQKPKCMTTNNQERIIGVNSSSDSSVSNSYESDTKPSGNVSLNNAAQLIQSPSHDLEEHVRNKDEISEEQSKGTSNLDFTSVDEVCAIPEIGNSVVEHDTECSNKSVLDDNKTNMNSVNAVIGNSTLPIEGDLVNSDSENGDPACENHGVERNPHELDKEDDGNQSINHGTNVFENESTDTGKIIQFELKPQSSEIKDRVMSFLTKCTNVDEASCFNATHDSSALKKECVKIKQIHVLNADDNASDVPFREQIENLKMKKKRDCSISDADSPVTNSVPPKLRFSADSRKLGTPGLSQSWHFELPVQNSPVNFTRFEIKENSNKKDNFESSTKDSFQARFHFLGSCTDQAPPGSTSENDPRVSNSVEENCNAENIPGFETDSRQLKCNSILNTLVPKKLQENSLFSSDSNFLNQNCHSNNDSQNENVKETGLNTSVFLSNNLPFCENEISLSRNNCHSFVFNSPCAYESNNSLQRHSTDNAVQSLISPWEKMSFQPQTTPSISSPILSSKSNYDNCSIKYSGFSASKRDLFHSDNEDSEMPAYYSKLGQSSRETKSSEAIYYNGPFPLSAGETYNLNVTNNQNITDSFFKTTKSGAYVENSSCGGNFSENCSNGNFQSVFPDSPAKQSNNHEVLFPSRVNLASNSMCIGSPSPNSAFKGNSNNPFAKKLPVESIGLFEPSIKTTVGGAVNSDYKSMSLPLRFVSPTEEKIHNQTQEFCGAKEKSNELTKPIFKGPLQFLFQPKLGNASDQIEGAFTEFASDVSKQGSSDSHGKPETNCGQVLSENCKQPEVSKPELSYASSGNTFSFQLTPPPENRKVLRCNRTLFPRIKESIKTSKSHEKGSSVYVMDMKENSNTYSIAERGISVPFKPIYGSDIKVECGVNKNVVVRYQNIVFMDEFLNVSPEELRSQFYTKMASEPFKFSASPESGKTHGFKKTFNQGSQTDEDVTCKKSDMTGIWRVLECPVCLDVVLPPVYQCEQGHHVCSPCWNKVVTCPLCKRRKSNTRNYMAEALIEQVPLPCRYHIEGCKESVQQNNKVSHEETCSFRTYQCPVPLCNQAHCYQNMCKHFKKLHKTLLHHEGHSVAKGEKFCDVLYKESLSLSLVHAFDISKWGLFFLREVTVKRSTALFVQVMPAARDQAAYFYHLEVSDHHDCRKECYKGRVFPIGKLTQEVVDQEEFLCLSELILKTVKTATPLKIVVTIWQLKPAFTISTE